MFHFETSVNGNYEGADDTGIAFSGPKTIHVQSNESKTRRGIAQIQERSIGTAAETDGIEKTGMNFNLLDKPTLFKQRNDFSTCILSLGSLGFRTFRGMYVYGLRELSLHERDSEVHLCKLRSRLAKAGSPIRMDVYLMTGELVSM